MTVDEHPEPWIKLAEDAAMGAGNPSPGAQHEPPLGWVQERTRVAVASGINVSGRLIFSEPVRIEGYFRGEVSSADLVVIADGATVEGRVRAPKLVVHGELRGDITGSARVYLGPRSRVRGDIHTANLTICEGAHFDGSVRMTES
jgi:cytoskeletal protein CcmA (bactofilin family)